MSVGKRRRGAVTGLVGVTFLATVFMMMISVWLLHGDTEYMSNTASFLSPTNTKNESHVQNSEDCFASNSEAWLKGPRLSNAPFASDDMAMKMIMFDEKSSPELFLKQTICHRGSSFLNWTEIVRSDDHNETINRAAMRLIYLAYHLHQHQYAQQEALARKQHSCYEQHNVSNFDYECPNAKFLVVPLGEQGLGAVMRLTVVNAMLAGMATNRVVLLVNDSPVGPDMIQTPWPQAMHCSNQRRDHGCVFMHMSPCVLTLDELSNAHTLERSEQRHMFRHGQIPEPHANDRVLVVKIRTRPHMAPPNVRENIVGILENHSIHLTEGQRRAILDIEPMPSDRYYYFGHNSKVHHAAVFYAMRPRFMSTIDKMVEQSLPDDFSPDEALGLPIRASDKCDVESECLDFGQYMKVMEYFRDKHLNGTRKTPIVLTTESQRIMDEMNHYTTEDFAFVVNRDDVLQESGFPKEFATHHNVLESSLVALKLQLHARITVGNCCSNFHTLIFDFLREGCGGARNSLQMCLQEMPQEEFRVCCGWDKSEECVAKRVSNNGTKS